MRVVQQIAVERANDARGLLYAAGRNDADSPGLIHALRRDCGRARTGAAPLPRNLVAQGSPQYVINSRGRRDTMAAVAQLAARRSHNLKVGSSILSCHRCPRDGKTVVALECVGVTSAAELGGCKPQRHIVAVSRADMQPDAH